MKIKTLILLVVLGLFSTTVMAMEKGIYLTSSTAENAKTLDYLIKQAKATGIGTFVVDVDAETKLYSKNVPEISKNGIKYVARIVVFPHGANASQMKSQDILNKRWKQIEYALSLGASAIQLDYIRYTSRGHAASPQNQKDVYGAISFFKNKLKEKNPNIALQADVFGTIAYKTETGIGQDIFEVAKGVDALNPMVYPSHFWPPAMHSMTPYLTVYDSIGRFKKKLAQNSPNTKVHAYIEVHNYRYPMSDEKDYKYILAQITGARDAGADGWYFWSAHNQYDNLFHVLKNNQVDTMKHDFRTAEAPKFKKRLFDVEPKVKQVEKQDSQDNNNQEKIVKTEDAKADVAKINSVEAKTDDAKAEVAKANPTEAKAEDAKAEVAKANPTEAKAEDAKAEVAKANPTEAKADDAKAEVVKANPAEAKAEDAKAEVVKANPAEVKAEDTKNAEKKAETTTVEKEKATSEE